MLVDTNILVYAINVSSPKHKAAQKFLLNNQGVIVVSHQNILEAVRVLTHPKFAQPMSADLAVKAILRIIDGCQVIVPQPGSDLVTLEFIKKFNLCGNRIFDAYLTATALSNGIEEIATDNVKDFEKFKGIRIFNPFS